MSSHLAIGYELNDRYTNMMSVLAYSYNELLTA